MTLRTLPSERWVRAHAGHALVVDTRRPLLFWEDHFPVPSYAIPEDDVRMDLLVSGEAPPQWHEFFGPHGPVTDVWDLTTADTTLHSMAWRRDDPALDGHLVLAWRPDALDWTEEDEPVFAHPRDPNKRVDALPSSRHVVVSVGGTVLADTRRPIVLFETGLPTRYYVPREHVRLEELTEVEHLTACPYKGIADQYWSLPGLDQVDWSYRQPSQAVATSKDHVAFYNEVVDTTVDDVLDLAPESPFNGNRP